MCHFPSHFRSPVQLGKGNGRVTCWIPGIPTRSTYQSPFWCPTWTFPTKQSLPETSSYLSFYPSDPLPDLSGGEVSEWLHGAWFLAGIKPWHHAKINHVFPCLSLLSVWKRQEQARERINKLCDHRSLDSTTASRSHLRRSPVVIPDRSSVPVQTEICGE